MRLSRTLLTTALSLGCTMTVREIGAAGSTDGEMTTDSTGGGGGADGRGGAVGGDVTVAGDGTDSADTSVRGGTDSMGGRDWPPGGENVTCTDNFGVGHERGYGFQPFVYTPQTSKSEGSTYSFTCTRCPNGYADISGTYRRYVDDNPTLPDPSIERETWTFDGNAFTGLIDAVDKLEFGGDGKRHMLTTRGYYFCPEPEALFGIDSVEYWNIVLVYTYVSEPGAFGIVVGATDPCFLGFSTQTKGDDIGVACNLEWDPKGTWQTTDLYCKVGATVEGRLCEDPFAD